jgi:hypothetical protein
MMPKSAKRFPAFAKFDSAGEARSDGITLSLMRIDRQDVIPGRAESANPESNRKDTDVAGFRVRPAAVPE